MYDKLINELRDGDAFEICGAYDILGRAADAIEELSMKLHGDEATIAGMKREIERMVVSNASNTLNNDAMRWIPVTEHLPEEMDRSCGGWSAEIRPSDDVLVWLSSEKRQSVAWYSHTYNEWTTVDENTVYCFEEVTQWQPLPQPPKEET